MTERIRTISRETLAECTGDWSERGTGPTEAYFDFMRRLGENAHLYTDYLSTAITAGGFKRRKGLPYGKVIDLNTEYAFTMADELHQNNELDVHRSVDAVALGKVAGWPQSDYLGFFFNIMARPDGHSNAVYVDKELNKIMQRSEGVDFSVFNNQNLTNDERLPHYLNFAQQYWKRLNELRVGINPINRLVRLSDWDTTLGGRAEEELATLIGARIATPVLATTTRDLASTDISPALKAQMQDLIDLGADVLGPLQQPRLTLQHNAPTEPPSAFCTNHRYDIRLH